VLDRTIVEAYRSARYRVDGTFDLTIDQPSAALDAWHLAKGRTCSALITACNPGSQICSDAINQAAATRLETIIRAQGLPLCSTVALDPSAEWPPEHGFLIAGLDQTAAKALGRQFGQNAVVWSGEDAVPRLILLR
jgi:hypothetical protein